MKIKSKHGDYSTDKARQRLVKKLSIHLSGETSPMEPYTSNDGDTSYWKIDAGNDWGVGFDPDEPDTFTINYRYQCEANRFEEVLFAFLDMQMMGLSVVEE